MSNIKAGDEVYYTTAKEYKGVVIGPRKSDGWWVLNRNPHPGDKGMLLPATNLGEGSNEMTPEVWAVIAPLRGVRVWHAATGSMTVTAAAQDPVREPDTSHIAGLSPEEVDWDAHRAFLREM